MSLARRDVTATAASGVWQSPYALPLTYLSITVRSAASGSVRVWWSRSVSQFAGAPAPDKVVSVGQTAVIDTGLPTTGAVYVADSGGKAFAVDLAGDFDPVGTASTSTPVTGDTLLGQFFTAINATNQLLDVAIPDGCTSVALFFTNIGAGLVSVTGHQSGLKYGNALPVGGATGVIQGPQRVFVSRAMDSSIDVSYTDQGTPNGATLYIVASAGEPLVSVEPWTGQLIVGQPPGSNWIVAPPNGALWNVTQVAGSQLVVATSVAGGPLAVQDTGLQTPLGGSVVTALTPGALLLTIPAGRVWEGSVGLDVGAVDFANVQVAGVGANPAPGVQVCAGKLITLAGAASTPVTPGVRVKAPAGNAVTLQAISGVAGSTQAWATGKLL